MRSVPASVNILKIVAVFGRLPAEVPATFLRPRRKVAPVLEDASLIILKIVGSPGPWAASRPLAVRTFSRSLTLSVSRCYTSVNVFLRNGPAEKKKPGE